MAGGAGADHGLSRRTFIAGSAGFGLAAMWPLGAASADTPTPPGFPSSIPLYREDYVNWSREIMEPGLWTCAPRSPGEVVTVANWARAHGYRMRARGFMHNWSPFAILPGRDQADPAILVDTARHLTAIRVHPGAQPSVSAQAGASLEAVLTALEEAGCGLVACPAPGNLTVGGMLAVGAHGSAIAARGETRPPGGTYGSISNLVLSLTAVVWDEARGEYVLRTFDRSHPHCKAFLTNLGRAFVTEATLAAVPNPMLRCVSRVDIPASELFAAPGSRGGRTFGGFVERSGRAEIIWFPHTERPWLKVWSVAPVKPLTSRRTDAPYNYPFSDNVPEELAVLADDIVSGNPRSTPAFGQTMYAVTAAGLPATASHDLWGASKNVLLYIKPSTLRVRECAYAILTRRSQVQRVVSEYAAFYTALVDHYAEEGAHPANMPVEIRVTGLDEAGDTGRPRGDSPALSALRPRPDRPEWDVAVWLNNLSFPGTPGGDEFDRDMEGWILANYTGDYAAPRPEWSKTWAYGHGGGWTDPEILGSTIPDAYRAGRHGGDDWDWAVARLDAYDPHRIFSNEFLDSLLR